MPKVELSEQEMVAIKQVYNIAIRTSNDDVIDSFINSRNELLNRFEKAKEEVADN